MQQNSSDKDIASRWDGSAAMWARTVRAGGDIYREVVNNPAFFKFLGSIRDKKVLDLGCGEGYNTRILAKKGAKVTGIDFSKELIKLAVEKEKEGKLGIKYCCRNAANLSIFKDNSFDVIVSFMALMDMRDLQSVCNEVRRVLKPKGRFVFSILHPCFNRWKSELGWEKDEKGNPLYYKIDNYFDEGLKEIVFTLGMGRVTLPKKILTFHYTLTSYFKSIHQAGMSVSRLEEVRPTKSAIKRYPKLKKKLRIPDFMIIEARKR